MELENFAADLDWEDDVDASNLDDDFDAEAEFEAEFNCSRDTMPASGFRRGAGC